MLSKFVLIVVLALFQYVYGSLRGSRAMLAISAQAHAQNKHHFRDVDDSKSLETFTATGQFVKTTIDCANLSTPYESNLAANVFGNYDINILRYKLRHCIPDPLGHAAAVKVVADNFGNVVLTTFSDTMCESELQRKHLDHSSLGTCRDSTVYQIQRQREHLPSAFTKRYYFDETCKGPHSSVQISYMYASGYTAGWQTNPNRCWNDPFSEQSYGVAMQYFNLFPKVILYSVSLEAFGSSNCGDNYMASYTDPAELPGYESCVAQGNHYVYTLLGGSPDYISPVSESTGQPSSQTNKL
jgi:hypothetical protein